MTFSISASSAACRSFSDSDVAPENGAIGGGGGIIPSPENARAMKASPSRRNKVSLSIPRDICMSPTLWNPLKIEQSQGPTREAILEGGSRVENETTAM